ncbi:MAG TPA: DUF885 family protein [Terriglobales bacterium]|nr:DUF885 family protein [Terriglobales bacterium]
MQLGSCARVSVCLLFLLAIPQLRADQLDDLAHDFWAWRASQMPVSTDDIPRLERPAGWVPDWSPKAVGRYREQLQKFESEWKAMDASPWPLNRQVDYRLIGSAISRVRWELDMTRGWQRNPLFYVDQSVGAYFHLLLPPPPFDSARSQQIIATLNSIPPTIQSAKQNLTEPVAPFAQLAIDELHEIGTRLRKSTSELKPQLDSGSRAQLIAATDKAAMALEGYRDWLSKGLPLMPKESAVGRDHYLFFLKNVALLPYTPEELLRMGRSEWARSVSRETYEAHRDQGQPQLSMFNNANEQIVREEKDEEAIRRYLESKNILSVPAWVPHYRFAPIPPYIEPVNGVWETDDFGGPGRLKQNGTRYIPEPGPKLGYFALATAKDPRPEIVHEGVPGHYFQLVLSWANPDPIRRHYYDSGANEGIGFYAEEMMMDAGVFDDSPRSREIVCNFMRLRALRVEVDVKLALGEFTIDQGAGYLHDTVPMDSETAHAEAKFFASTPGQAISYQIGKLQIFKFLADARRKQGDAFQLRAFHDHVWQNGNVPIALQRWEYLGLKDDLETLDKLH